MPEYSVGACQSIGTRSFSNGKRYLLPRFNFIDEYTQSQWAKHFVRRAKQNKEDRSQISICLADVMRYRANEKRTEMLEIRRRGQRANGDNLGREGLIDRIKRQPLIPQTFRYERAIGIEIECCRPDGRKIELPVWSRETGDGSIRSFPARSLWSIKYFSSVAS